MIVLPSSKDKRYLTGIDWVVQSLAAMTRQATGLGNASRIVFELESPLDADTLREFLDQCTSKYPVLWGRTARDYNLAPYWKPCPSDRVPPLRIIVDSAAAGARFADLLPLFEREVNTPFKSPHEHLTFHLVNAGDRSFFGMGFDHCVLDARGAESFMGLLQREWEEGESGYPTGFPTAPAHLSQWWEKFLSGQRVNRAFLWLGKNGKPRTLSLPSDEEGKRITFRVLQFREDQTTEIIERAYDRAGYLLVTPYLVAAAVRSVHTIASERGVEGKEYVVPVTIDLRPSEKQEDDVFFNHISFLLFRVPASKAEHASDILGILKTQMYDQMKSGLAADIARASLLMRILPRRAFGWFVRLYLRGQTASFASSYVGESAYKYPEFMGVKIRNLCHLPSTPVPPGLGIFFNRFRGRLNVTLSYLQGMLAEGEIDTAVAHLLAELGVMPQS